jgi:hypothetical protein
MKSILRSVGAVVAAFVVAVAIMMTVETLNGRVFYPELGRAAEGVTDPDVVRQLMAAAPVGALLVVLIGWALSSVVAGWVAARLAGGSPMAHATVIGAILTLCGVANNLMLPPPMWFWAVSMVVFLPAAWLGGRMVRPT